MEQEEEIKLMNKNGNSSVKITLNWNQVSYAAYQIIFILWVEHMFVVRHIRQSLKSKTCRLTQVSVMISHETQLESTHLIDNRLLVLFSASIDCSFPTA